MSHMSRVARDEGRYACQVAVRVNCPSWQNYLDLYATNISNSGLFIASDVMAKVGTEVTVELVLPNGVPLQLMAKVMHHKAAGMGLMFMSSDDKTKAALESMVSVAKFTFQHSNAIMSTGPGGKAKSKPATAEQLRVRGAGPQARAPDHADVVEQTLQEEVARRRALTAHQQLGVSSKATRSEIDKAYNRLSERYHPTIFEKYPAGTRELVKQLHMLMQDAHSKLVK
jgi:hypothetical protein